MHNASRITACRGSSAGPVMPHAMRRTWRHVPRWHRGQNLYSFVTTLVVILATLKFSLKGDFIERCKGTTAYFTVQSFERRDPYAVMKKVSLCKYYAKFYTFVQEKRKENLMLSCKAFWKFSYVRTDMTVVSKNSKGRNTIVPSTTDLSKSSCFKMTQEPRLLRDLSK